MEMCRKSQDRYFPQDFQRERSRESSKTAEKIEL